MRRHRRHRQDGEGQDRRHPLYPRKVVKLEPIPFPEPCYSVAITPKTKGQEDKIAAGLIRLNEEDLTFNWVNNAETRQMVVSGTGDMQMDVILSRLKSRFGVDAELSEPRVPYRERSQEGGGAGPPQEEDRRPRPVRRRVDAL